MPNTIQLTNNTSASPQRWDLTYTADQSGSAETTLNTAGTFLDKNIKATITVPAGQATTDTAAADANIFSTDGASAGINIAGVIGTKTNTEPISGYYVAVNATGSGGSQITRSGWFNAGSLPAASSNDNIRYFPISTATVTISGGDLSVSSNYTGTPTVTIGTGTETNMENIALQGKNLDTHPYFFKIEANSSSLSGSTGVVRNPVKSIHTAGYLPAKSESNIIASDSASPTVTVNSGTTNTYINLKAATVTIETAATTKTNYTDTPIVSVVSGQESNMAVASIGAKNTTTYPYYFKVNSSSSALNGSTSVTSAAVYDTRTAGYLPGRAKTAIKNSETTTTTVTVNAGSGSTYVNLPEAVIEYPSLVGVNIGNVTSTPTGFQASATQTPYSVAITGTNGSFSVETTVSAAGYLPDTYEHTQNYTIDFSSVNTNFYIPVTTIAGSVVDLTVPTINLTSSVNNLATSETATTHYFTIGHTKSDGSVKGRAAVTGGTGMIASGTTDTSTASVITPTVNNSGTTVYIKDGSVTTSYSQDGMGTYFDAGTSSDKNVTITPKYTTSAGYINTVSTAANNGGVGYWKIKTTSVTQGTTTVSDTTATRGSATWGTGWISSGSITPATFANSATSGVTYVDISATTAAPVLVSGGYLYINKGYTDNLRISLAKLVPDGATVGLASSHILSGYSAYNNEGVLVAGNIASKGANDITVNGPTVTIPAGFYGDQVTKTIANGAYSATGTKNSNGSVTPTVSINNASSYGFTTSQPSGTNGTNFLTITPGGSASDWSATATATITTAGYLTTGNKTASISGTPTVNSGTLQYVPIVTPSLSGGGLTTSSDTNTVTAPQITIAESGSFFSSTDYGVTTTAPSSGTDGTNFLTINESHTVTNGSAVSAWGVSRAALSYSNSAGVIAAHSGTASNLGSTSTSGGKTTAITPTITDSFENYYIPITSVSFTPGSWTTNTNDNTIATTPVVTVASSGTFKSATNYGVTTTKPSGTDGTNYLTIDGTGSVTTTGKATSSWKATYSATTYSNAAGAIAAHSGATALAAHDRSGTKDVNITPSITDSFAPLYIPIVSPTFSGGGLSGSTTTAITVTGMATTTSTTSYYIDAQATGTISRAAVTYTNSAGAIAAHSGTSALGTGSRDAGSSATRVYIPAAAGTVTISGANSTPTLASNTNSGDEISGKTKLTIAPVTDKTTVGSTYYLVYTATSPAKTPTFTASVGTAGYLGTTSQLSGAGSITASNQNYYIPIQAGSATVAGGGLSNTNNYTGTPTVTVALSAQTTSGAALADSAPSSGYYLTITGSTAKMTGTTKVTRANITLARTAGWVTDQNATTVISSTTSSPSVTVNAASATKYITLPTATFSTSGNVVSSSAAGWVPANTTLGTVGTGAIAINQSLPSGSSSSGTINRGTYIKIGAGYYASTLYYLAQNVSNGTITNNTTLPSGTSSSGTINRGKYIKIGAGYYSSDAYYLAQANSGTKTITGSGNTSVDGYATASVAAAVAAANTATADVSVYTTDGSASGVNISGIVGTKTDSEPTSGYYLAFTGSGSGSSKITTAGWIATGALAAASTTATKYFPITAAAFTVSGNVVYCSTAGYVPAGSASAGVGTISAATIKSGSATISSATYAYDSTNTRFNVTGSATVAAPSVSTAGYVSGSVGTKQTNTASLSTTVARIAIKATNSVPSGKAAAVTPVISRTSTTASGATNVGSSDATTTAPSSGYFISVQSAANTTTLTATPSVTTAGYGTTTSGQYGATNATTTVGANASSVTYIPITTGIAAANSASVTKVATDGSNAGVNITGVIGTSVTTEPSSGYYAAFQGSGSSKVTTAGWFPTGALAAATSAVTYFPITAANGQVDITNGGAVTPTISKLATPSGVTITNAASGNATTSPTTNGVYVVVQSGASTKTLTAKANVTTAGYVAVNSNWKSNTSTVGANASSVTYIPITTANPTFTGGAITGSTTLTPTNVTLSDTNNGIKLVVAGSATRAKVTYAAAVAGWVSKSNGADAYAASSATSITGLTKYITAITVPKDKTFSLTTTADTALDSTSTISITNNAYRRIDIQNNGHVNFYTATNGSGKLWASAYDSQNNLKTDTVIENGKWVLNHGPINRIVIDPYRSVMLSDQYSAYNKKTTLTDVYSSGRSYHNVTQPYTYLTASLQTVVYRYYQVLQNYQWFAVYEDGYRVSLCDLTAHGSTVSGIATLSYNGNGVGYNWEYLNGGGSGGVPSSSSNEVFLTPGNNSYSVYDANGNTSTQSGCFSYTSTNGKSITLNNCNTTVSISSVKINDVQYPIVVNRGHMFRDTSVANPQMLSTLSTGTILTAGRTYTKVNAGDVVCGLVLIGSTTNTLNYTMTQQYPLFLSKTQAAVEHYHNGNSTHKTSVTSISYNGETWYCGDVQLPGVNTTSTTYYLGRTLTNGVINYTSVQNMIPSFKGVGLIPIDKGDTIKINAIQNAAKRILDIYYYG